MDISFYHLTTLPLSKALPKLLEKMLKSEQKAVLLTANEEHTQQLDEALWRLGGTLFIPHGTAHDPSPERQPVFITHEEKNPAQASFLFTTGGIQPSDEYRGHFTRLFDLFDGNAPEEVTAARGRWKHYQQAGYTLAYWKQDAKGNWLQA